MRVFSSPIYIGFAALLLFVLSVRVIALRRRYRVGLGDGGHPELSRAIRAHANFVEYAPLALLLILAADLVGHDKWLVHLMGILLLVGRVMHAYGLSRDGGASPGRVGGMVLTFFVLLLGASLAIASFFNVRI